MKKLLALLMAICMVLAFTACAQIEAEKNLALAESQLKDAEDSGDIDDVADALDNYADQAASAGATTNMSAKDIVDLLINDASFQAELETVKSQGLSCKLEARGNSIAYVYQYTFDIGDITVAKTALDASKSSLQTLADSLCKVYTGIDSVIFEYLTYDGSIIATYEF